MRGEGRRRGNPGGVRCSPARGLVGALGMGFPLHAFLRTWGSQGPYCRPYWVGSSQSLGEVRHTADHTPSSQSPLSVSPFQGKAESRGSLFGPELGLMPRFFRCSVISQESGGHGW